MIQECPNARRPPIGRVLPEGSWSESADLDDLNHNITFPVRVPALATAGTLGVAI
jgi:hypothetical protein